MKRPSAIRQLVTLAELASERSSLRDTPIGWPLDELWATDEVLTPTDEFDTFGVVAVLELPPEELSWLTIHPVAEIVVDHLHLRKRPVRWCYRPSVWPAWNHENRRLARFWSATAGADEEVIEAIAASRLDQVVIVEPTDEELAAQLDEELGVSRRHLHHVLDRYWDGEWRRDHRGVDGRPEDHLWRAAVAVRDMTDVFELLTLSTRGHPNA